MDLTVSWAGVDARITDAARARNKHLFLISAPIATHDQTNSPHKTGKLVHKYLSTSQGPTHSARHRGLKDYGPIAKPAPAIDHRLCLGGLGCGCPNRNLRHSPVAVRALDPPHIPTTRDLPECGGGFSSAKHPPLPYNACLSIE
ncbi:hypothetical protein RhiXN_04529 [Rhizoctonia solani]|uniref:Uncharacterized protein n=1 Tax=Rhizoctonia solani TaxID=456999 RepID=A0A8H8STY1_9AGAM|nr:uncharacterized protein RhiXN_04529 [Rhizoctonia solani]QRW16528.1 hypothetical protein RhiXN_04529 [Rhizoctonia solani]